MKYQKIKSNPEEVLEGSEGERFALIYDYIDHLQVEKLTLLPLTDLFNAIVFLNMRKDFYMKKYAQSYDPNQNRKEDLNMKQLKKIIFTQRMAPNSYGLVERMVEKNSNKSILQLADVASFHINFKGEKEAEKIAKEILAEVEEIEESVCENKN